MAYHNNLILDQIDTDSFDWDNFDRQMEGSR